LFNFQIFETQDYLDQLEELLGRKQEAFNKKLQEYVYPQLRRQPYFGKNIKKLKAFSPPTWRYRIGGIRLFYQIDSNSNIVLMTAAMLRKDAYRNF
jgi:mRNA interferase RelE/StbE